MPVSPPDKTISFVIKPVLFLLCLLPLGVLVWAVFNDMLGANPAERLTRETGEWTLRFLLITLAVTPVRKLLRSPWLIKLRRMLGLYVFFYASIHMLTYIWFDQFFDVDEIIRDVIKRPFITVGFLAFILLIPLVLTSTNKMIRRLKKNWVKLHKLIYVIAVLAILHFFWLVKADYQELIVYGLILLLLLFYRLYQQRKKGVY
ncbi:MAG: sulfoxide reductase heme-binding subunit YedZ [Gammaproteobacteria bacterium]|nr:sulfoxide reductase heme-binding subunit YedZ [Gammaproteobacteria bacterium]MCW8924355.1 sulfoxide reductase heme-binding subunit YedZ [Gammaproteobacteria bacterium]